MINLQRFNPKLETKFIELFGRISYGLIDVETLNLMYRIYHIITQNPKIEIDGRKLVITGSQFESYKKTYKEIIIEYGMPLGYVLGPNVKKALDNLLGCITYRYKSYGKSMEQPLLALAFAIKLPLREKLESECILKSPAMVLRNPTRLINKWVEQWKPNKSNTISYRTPGAPIHKTTNPILCEKIISKEAKNAIIYMHSFAIAACKTPADLFRFREKILMIRNNPLKITRHSFTPFQSESTKSYKTLLDLINKRLKRIVIKTSRSKNTLPPGATDYIQEMMTNDDLHSYIELSVHPVAALKTIISSIDQQIRSKTIDLELLNNISMLYLHISKYFIKNFELSIDDFSCESLKILERNKITFGSKIDIALRGSLFNIFYYAEQREKQCDKLSYLYHGLGLVLRTKICLVHSSSPTHRINHQSLIKKWQQYF